MGKLAGCRTYLCGSMDRVADGGAQWRDDITPLLQTLGVIVIDPRFKPIEMGKEDAEKREIRHKAKVAGDWDAVEADRDIRTIDLRCVDVIDFLTVYINMDAKPFGTIEEITLANRQKKPIIVFVEGGKKNTPDWLVWMIRHATIFDSMGDAMVYLRGIDSGELVPGKRWLLFNWKPLIAATEKYYGRL